MLHLFLPQTDFEYLNQCHTAKRINDTNCFYMLKKICENDMMDMRGAVSRNGSFLTLIKRGAVYMSYQNKSIKKVYYHILKGSRYILADERNKKKLLDIVLGIYRENDWNVCAFCVMDESMYFVTEAREQDAVRHEIRRAIDEFFTKCKENIPQLHGCVPFLTSYSLEELDTLETAARYCRQIHRLPLEAGYVGRIEDYWWSSYRTYTGEYEWDGVDCRLFFRFFSLNPETARKKLLCFHE